MYKRADYYLYLFIIWNYAEKMRYSPIIILDRSSKRIRAKIVSRSQWNPIYDVFFSDARLHHVIRNWLHLLSKQRYTYLDVCSLTLDSTELSLSLLLPLFRIICGAASNFLRKILPDEIHTDEIRRRLCVWLKCAYSRELCLLFIIVDWLLLRACEVYCFLLLHMTWSRDERKLGIIFFCRIPHAYRF